MSFFSRRGFFKTAGQGLGLLALSPQLLSRTANAAGTAMASATSSIPFFGKYQAGITTPQQVHTYFISFDLKAASRDEVIDLMKVWTEIAARLTKGQAAAPAEKDLTKPGTDTGEAAGLGPARLTLTFGFGPGLFSSKDGKDRYGLLKHKPAALADLPKFHGDQLIEEKSGGDLSIQACADDPQVAFHAIRQLARAAGEHVETRWVQSGFLSGGADGSTPRNLMGFKDGTQQPASAVHDRFVWADKEGPAWMHNGTYLVTRKIRVALEHWDRTEVDFQQEVIGRHKDTGAPLGKKRERDPLDLERTNSEGNLVIPDTAHVRLAAAASNEGAQILRRGYSYNDGVSFVAERWPPWHQGMEYDAGLFFIGYQTDPRTSFVKIFGNLAKIDALNQFATHITSGLFACPPGVQKGEYIGQKLFTAT